MRLEIHGYASVKADVHTVADLRDFVKWLDKHAVPGERVVDWDQHLWLTLSDTNTGDTAELIECGDHVPPAAAFDVLLTTHAHESTPAPARDVPEYDWITKDKYATVWDGLPE